MIRYIETTSVTVSYLIFGWSIISYVAALAQKPFEAVAALGLSAFALIAALSGLCFAMAQVLEHDKPTAIYCGEKMLHSTMSILQTVALKYASETALSSDFLRSHGILSETVFWISTLLQGIISGYAAYFFLYGFEALHDFLWDRYHVRKQQLHREPSRTK